MVSWETIAGTMRAPNSTASNPCPPRPSGRQRGDAVRASPVRRRLGSRLTVGFRGSHCCRSICAFVPTQPDLALQLQGQQVTAASHTQRPASRGQTPRLRRRHHGCNGDAAHQTDGRGRRAGMNEHSLQVVISGQGEQQVCLRWQGAATDRRLVVQIASLPAPTPIPPRLEGPSPVTQVSTSSPPPALSLELRWSEPPPILPAAPPKPRSEPAPLATAWAMAELLQRRPPMSSSTPPRRRSARTSRG
jgi:hypothetical protein